MDRTAALSNTSHLPFTAAGEVTRAAWQAESVVHVPATSNENDFANLSDDARIQTIKFPFHATPRETEVAYWMIMGKTRAEIAMILGGLNPHTVGDHIKALYRKACDVGLKITNKVEFTMMFARYNEQLVDAIIPKYPREKFERLPFEQKYILKLVAEGKTDPEIADLVNRELRPRKVKTASAVADFLKRFMERTRRGA